MQSFTQSSTIAVIGAGPSGLAAARRFIEVGFDVTVFERRAGPGGTWLFDSTSPAKPRMPTSHLHYRDPTGDASLPGGDLKANQYQYPSSCYQSLMTNVKTPLMQFEQFYYPQHTPWFVPHDTILHYLEGFATYSGVNRVTRYNTNVISIKEAGGGRWKLLTHNTRHYGHAQGACFDSHEQVFDKVVVCTGHFDSPYVPAIPGLSEWYAEWPEKFFHSKEYRTNRIFRDKNVLLVGAGSSAYDIGREIASVAKVVYQIVRQKSSGAWSSTVNSIMPENIITKPGVAGFGSIIGRSSIKDAHVILEDGETITGLDAVVFCTGYRFSLPFLPDYQAVRTDGEMTIDRQTLITDGARLHNLHKDMFFIPHPTLAFIGVPFATFLFLEIQADTIAAVFSGKAKLPDEEQMYAEYADQQLGPPLWTLGIDEELEYVRNTQTWSSNPSEQLKLRQYERALKDAEKAFPDALARYLRSSRILQNQDPEEVERIITRKVQMFKLAVSQMS